MKTIRIKILLPVVILSLVGLVAAGVGVLGIRKIMGRSSVITENAVPCIAAADEVVSGYQKLQQLLYAHIVTKEKEKRMEIEVEIQKERMDITQKLADFQTFLKKKEEKEVYQKCKASYNSFLNDYQDAISWSRSEVTDKAVEIANGVIAAESKEMDAKQINIAMDEVGVPMEQLSEIMRQMTGSISQVSDSVMESARETSGARERTDALVGCVEATGEEIKRNESIAARLLKEAEAFGGGEETGNIS